MSHTLIVIYLNNVRNNKSKEKRNNHANVKNLCIHWFVVGEWRAKEFVISGRKTYFRSKGPIPADFRSYLPGVYELLNKNYCLKVPKRPISSNTDFSGRFTSLPVYFRLIFSQVKGFGDYTSRVREYKIGGNGWILAK